MQTTASDATNGHLTGYGSPSYRHYVLILLMLVYTLNFIDRTLIAVVAQPIIESFQLTDASGELNELHWLTLNEARQLDLPAVTRWAIDLVERRIQLSQAEQLRQTAPFVRFAKGQEISIDL